MAKVLLADESVTIQKVVDLVLSEEGHEIKSVNSGDEALSTVQTFTPDIVLADIKIKGKNGYEIASQIKNNPQTSHIPVLLLAGAFDPVNEEQLRTSGADGALTKPFESKELIEKIKTLTGAVSAPEAASPSGVEEAAFSLDEAQTGTGDAEPVFAAEEGNEELLADLVEAAEVDKADEDDLWDLGALEPDMEESPTMEAEEKGGAETTTSQEAGEGAPAFQGMEEVPAASPGTAARAMPSAEKLSDMFMEALHARLDEMVQSLNIRELLSDIIAPGMKETVEKILWEVTPELTEKLLREAVSETMNSLNKDLENIIWETVPELAETIIRKEIEKIRSEG